MNYRVVAFLIALCLLFAMPTVAAEVHLAEESERATYINAGLEDMARSLASVLLDPEARQLVYEEVALRFDGDTNALFLMIADRAMSQGTTFEQALAVAAAERSGSSYGKAFDDSLGAVRALSTTLPRLQIAVPVHFDTWDPETYAPLVTYWPFDADEEDVEELVAFDGSGDRVILDPNIEPMMPVVVLGINERIDEDGNLRSARATKARNYGDDEILQKMRIFDDNEGWLQGNPEIYMTWSFTSGYSGQYFPPGVDNENQWYYLNDRLFPWLQGYSLVYTVEFWEQDSGPNDFMGSASVYFGDTSGTCYTTTNNDVEFCMSHAPPPCTAVGTPQIFIVTNSSHPQFYWSAVAGAESYYIYGSSGSGSYTYLGSTSSTTWTDYFRDIDAIPGGSDGGFYRYKVRSVNSGPNCSPLALSNYSNYIEFAVLTDDPGGGIGGGCIGEICIE